MVDEDDAVPLAPQLLQNRTFSSSITDAALCPRMDLVALVLDAKTIVIHRFNWQRLAMFAPSDGSSSEKIVSIAWSPDGALLAVALDNGTLSLYAVDSSVTHASKKDSSAAIATVSLQSNPTALSWDILRDDVEKKGTDVWEEAYAERPYPPLRTEAPTGGNKRKQAVLVVGDADGCVSFYGFDLAFAIGKTRVFEPGVRVDRAFMAKACIVALGTKNDVLLSSSIQLARFHSLQSEIWRVGSEVVALTDIRKQLLRDVAHITQRWEACMKSSMLRSIEYPMEDALVNEEDVNVWDALCDAHHSAVLHPTVATCLASEIGEGGVREALRTFRGGQDDVEETLLRICGTVEMLLFRASEYRGLAAVSSKFGTVGVNTRSIEDAVRNASELMEEVGDLIAVLYTVCVETEWFLEWLIIEAQRADKEPEEAVKVASLPTDPQESVRKFFERHLADKQAGVKDVFSRTLEVFKTKKLDGMLSMLDEMIARPFVAISRTVLDTHAVAVSVSSGVSPRKASILEHPGGAVDVCAAERNGRVAVLRFSTATSEWKGCWIEVDLKKSQVLLSWSHYKEMFLAVTAEESATEDDGTLFPLKLNVWKNKGFTSGKWVGLKEVKHGVEVLECEPLSCNDLHVAFELKLPSTAKNASLDVCGKNARYVRLIESLTSILAS